MAAKPQIQDIGEKLGGARKDEESFGSIGRIAAAQPLLDQLWPAPKNWRDLLETKKPEEVVRLMVIRGNLSKGPHPDSYYKKSAKYWESQYRTSILAIQTALALDIPNSDMERVKSHYKQLVSKEGLTERENALAQAAIGKGYQRSLKHPFHLSPIDGMRYKYLAHMGWAEDDRIPNDFSYGALNLIRKRDKKSLWKAVNGVSGAWTYLSRNEHPTETEAVAEALAETQTWLTNQQQGVKTKSTWKWTRPSSETDKHRNAPTANSFGRRPEELIERFKIRGIEFGKWGRESRP